METIEGRSVGPKQLALLGPGEAPVFATFPRYATVRAEQHWDNALLLLTSQRLLITRDKLIGRAKADFECPWEQVKSVDGRFWNHVRDIPYIALLVSNERTHTPVELIVSALYAVNVESAIRSGYQKLS